MASSISPSPSFLDETLLDVDDYELENGSEDLSWDTLHYVDELVKNGNAAFRENRMEEALGLYLYMQANDLKPGDPIILSNRCAAYIRISESLMQTPASSSEHRPLGGMEPTIIAERCLSDAEKLVELQSNSAKSYLLKARALLLLEKYEKARDVILSGLQVDPFSNSLRASLENLERVSSSSTGMSTHGHLEHNDDFDCTLCLKLLYEPVTTPCGHSFCRSCLFQSMDRGNRCPLCRTVLFISPRTCSLSLTLRNIIQENFAEEYAKRNQEHDSLINAGVDLLPILVMDVAIPYKRFAVEIVESQYRLMVRRIMEGDRRMGMTILDSTGSLPEFACEVEITECKPHSNGRFDIEVESHRRFRIIRSWDQDGYRVAEVEWIQDIMPPEGTSERETLQQQTYDAAEHVRLSIARAKEAARHDLVSVAVMMPSPADPERFSFWLATLFYVSLSPVERLDLLCMRDTAERIRRGLVFLRQKEQEEQSCIIQ